MTLTFEQIKELMDTFVRLKLNNLKVGDIEFSKTYYETEKTSPSGNISASPEEALFYSAASALPPEVIEMLAKNKVNNG